jgi:hypothetical protein
MAELWFGITAEPYLLETGTKDIFDLYNLSNLCAKFE